MNSATTDSLSASPASLANRVPDMNTQVTKPARKQWSSCDFCRERKKKCDAIRRKELGSNQCSRCFEYDVKCTFSFVSQKSTIRTAKRRQSLAAKHAQQSLPAAESYDFGTGQSIGLVSENDCSAGAFEDNFHTELERVTFEPNAISIAPVDVFGLTDKELEGILYPDGCNIEPDNPATESFIQEGIWNAGYSDTREIICAESSTTLCLSRTVTGLSSETELFMLSEYASLGHLQMPVIDIDMVFLRYRYSMPTPLPRLLVLAIIACGSHYSSQRAEPGIDRQSAQMIFEMAKVELLGQATAEISVDIASALFIVYFHWQGDLSTLDRDMLLLASIRKIHKLGIHKEHLLQENRTKRERGLLRYFVWLVFIVDAFSSFVDAATGQDHWSRDPFDGADVELNKVNVEDMEAMTHDLITGQIHPFWTPPRLQLSVAFNGNFASLAQLQNKVKRLQRRGESVQHLRSELHAWELRGFSSFDVSYRTWDYERLVYVEFDGMTAAVLSMNFSYWYCNLNLHFDNIRPHLNISTTSTNSPASVPQLLDDMDEDNLRTCCKAFTATISIFETLCSGGRIFQTSQVVRQQLYFAGRVLQLFYKNRLSVAGLQVVDSFLLQRWERCLEISELVWGYSSRGLDLSQMRLDEID